MDISLRKANALQQAINDAVKQLDLTTGVAINEFQTPKTVINTASERFWTNLERRNNLVDALFEIRRDVARVNASSGITDTLALLARTEKQIGFYSGLSNTPVAVDMEIVVGRLGKIKSRDTGDSRYGHGVFDNGDEVRTTVLTQTEIDNVRLTLNDLKRKKQSLQDELLEMNVRNNISLSTSAIEILKSEEIL